MPNCFFVYQLKENRLPLKNIQGDFTSLGLPSSYRIVLIILHLPTELPSLTASKLS